MADREQVSTPQFIERLAHAAQTSPRLFRLPQPILRTLLRVGGRGEANDSLLGSLELDLSKVAAIGWQPPISLDDGLKLAMSQSSS
ncbi:hypothetical protein [Bradyrhizobium sp. ISRA463]|uniref:hypothetical protein n=1 Tax=Bradyrhizobium sp. ISRA463 TaxID=2866199 RepID=UPI002478BAAE|nr:hypothetical protein [Bradyrhizobium sp. ISRA463]WGS24134.1 hypothetical protein MTX22_15360 [Bradyrhizobium sp. ISRA463]